MQGEVRSTIQREEQLLDLMIEFVQRGERKNDIQYLLRLRDQQMRERSRRADLSAGSRR